MTHGNQKAGEAFYCCHACCDCLQTGDLVRLGGLRSLRFASRLRLISADMNASWKLESQARGLS
jgi:hypothetical protein